MKKKIAEPFNSSLDLSRSRCTLIDSVLQNIFVIVYKKIYSKFIYSRIYEKILHNFQTLLSLLDSFGSFSLFASITLFNNVKVLPTRCKDPVNRTFTLAEKLLSFKSWIISRACWIVGQTLSWASLSFGFVILSQMALCRMQRSSCVFFKAPLKFSRK